MERIAYLAAVALMFAAALPTTPAQAQNNRSFVSAQSGLDTNPCTRTSPCRTFAHALTQTNAGGEINTLDPGGYGSVTIDRAISIVSGLGEAGVLVPSGGTGIIINGLPILALEPDLDRYFSDNVIGGPGAFVIAAESYETFADAILKKLIREMAAHEQRPHAGWYAARPFTLFRMAIASRTSACRLLACGQSEYRRTALR